MKKTNNFGKTNNAPPNVDFVSKINLTISTSSGDVGGRGTTDH